MTSRQDIIDDALDALFLAALQAELTAAGPAQLGLQLLQDPEFRKRIMRPVLRRIVRPSLDVEAGQVLVQDERE